MTDIPRDYPLPGTPTLQAQMPIDSARQRADLEVQVYVRHGYFAYTVSSPEQAVAHAEAIMSNRTYRRSIPGGMEMHSVYKVKVKGPGLESQYTDQFRRT